ncbi:MAG TPA: uracil-DNA glycosylase [Tepidisphaeraceae bacterium]|nr:uracil-DNA glycosylase [Tepidisphaeraceae bacterium]
MKSSEAKKTRRLPGVARQLKQLHAEVMNCTRCQRLRTYCADVAATKRRSYAEQEYWGKPVPAWGDPLARLWIIGLAPAAHGGNRTGRIFTGDRSGDFLFAGLHRAGYANQPTSVHREDGLQLRDCYISATARCAPPGNKPLPIEVSNCASYLDREWSLLRNKRVILALGGIAWDAALALAARNACELSQPKPKFAHGSVVKLWEGLHLVGSYHVSQQNTFTGRLTDAMFDAVLNRCRGLS